MPTDKAKTPQELAAAAAESQIASEIAGETAPLEAEVSTAEAQRENAIGGLNTLFGTLQPAVEQSAQRYADMAKGTYAEEKSLFEHAKNQLGMYQQQRAAEAQAFAQKIGGPIDMAQFMSGFGTANFTLPATTANTLMHSLGTHRAGVAEAEAFAGRVFPLIRKEEQDKIMTRFDETISGLRKEIASIKSGAAGRKSKRANELLIQEREHKLALAQQALERLKANRDYQLTRESLKNEKERIWIAKQELEANIASVSGTYKGKPTEAARQFNKQLNLEQQRLAREEIINSKEMKAWDLVTAATTPGEVEFVTTTQEMEVGKGPRPPRGYEGKSYRRQTGKNKDGTPIFTWYITKDVKSEAPRTPPIDNPSLLHEYLTRNGIPKAMATRIVRQHIGEPDWVHGEADPRAPVGGGIVG